MGMFDTVTFRYRMPDGETESEYQTKSLVCECEFYEISAEGRLLKWQADVGGYADTNFEGAFTMTANEGYLLRGLWYGLKCTRRGINAGRSILPGLCRTRAEGISYDNCTDEMRFSKR